MSNYKFINLSQTAQGTAILIVASLLYSHAAAAGEQVLWSVDLVEGSVQARVGQDNWSAVQEGQVLMAGSQVITGSGGQLSLSNGGDEITAGPDTDFTVSNGTGEEPYSILQSMGRMLFRMESRATRDFSVGTPYLAAAIKGTTFTVDVEAKGASVSVAEGTVEVTLAATGDVVMVDAGSSVTAAGALRTPATLEEGPPRAADEAQRGLSRDRGSGMENAGGPSGTGAAAPSDAAADRGRSGNGKGPDGNPGGGRLP